MTACVILNYNDVESTLTLLKTIEKYNVFCRIVVVDGASTDSSYEQLKKIQNEKVKVILADKNGGYGYGNNIGIKYCVSLGMDTVVIANPDVNFSEQTIANLCEFLRGHKECAAVGARVVEEHRKAEPAFKICTPMKDISYSLMCLNKIIRPRYYPESYFNDKLWCYVDAIPGSLVAFDIAKFLEAGMYDENVFLYTEELIIGKKFQHLGYKSAVVLTESYQHMHSVSVKKNVSSAIAAKKLTMRSQQYYLKNYCMANRFVMLLFTLVKPLAYLEMLTWDFIKTKVSE